MIDYVYIQRSGPESPRNDTASIVELPGGKLLVAWHKYKPGPEGASDFGLATIACKSSQDGGRSWGDERLLVDVAPGDVNVQAPALCLLPSGEILLACLRAHGKSSTSMLLYRSRDGGSSFAFDRAVWERSQGQWLQGGASQLLRLSGGRLLLPFHGGTGDQGGQHNVIRCHLSDDGGRSWASSRSVIDLPMRGAMEGSVAEASAGVLLMSIRTQLGSVFVSRSSDGGESWSLPQTSGLRSPESCSCLRRIPGTGRLALLWNHSLYDPSHHHYGIRTPLTAAVSDDVGETWRRIGDIDGGDTMLTNIGCTFVSTGKALVTYLHVDDKEVKDGAFVRLARGGWGASEHVGLKCAIVDAAWFLRD